MENLKDLINHLDIHTALWNVYKQLPWLLGCGLDLITEQEKALIKHNLGLFKSSTLAPVFESTRIDQLHTLGSATWAELTAYTNFLSVLLNTSRDIAVGWEDDAPIFEPNAYGIWFDTMGSISGYKFEFYMIQLSEILAEQLCKMEVWT